MRISSEVADVGDVAAADAAQHCAESVNSASAYASNRTFQPHSISFVLILSLSKDEDAASSHMTNLKLGGLHPIR
jgi:hypothetical protein